MVCKKFNEIATPTRFYGLELCSDDEDFFESIMKSKRRVKRLSISSNKFQPSGLDRLTQVIKNVGKDVKILKVYHIVLPRNFVELLNLMPNLEKITFFEVRESEKFFVMGNLELRELKKVRILSCQPKIFVFFNYLPPGVLKKLCFTRSDDDFDSSDKFFMNQNNIREIKADEVLAKCFEWSKVKLKEIVLTGKEFPNHVMEKVLMGQDELETATIFNKISEFSFNLICNELKSLVALTIFDIPKAIDRRPNFSNLHNLKFLELTLSSTSEISDKYFNSFLSSLRNKSLENLRLKFEAYSMGIHLTVLTMTQVGLNLPLIKNLFIDSQSPIDSINAIIKNCENLEDLEWRSHNSEIYTFEKGLRHEKLKKLQIKAYRVVDDKNDLPKLIGCCVKLKYVYFCFTMHEKFLSEAFRLQQNLKTLLVSCDDWDEQAVKLTLGTIKTIKENGKRLEEFFVFPCVFEDEITSEIVAEEFKDQFKIIKIWDDKWEMSSRN